MFGRRTGGQGPGWRTQHAPPTHKEQDGPAQRLCRLEHLGQQALTLPVPAQQVELYAMHPIKNMLDQSHPLVEAGESGQVHANQRQRGRSTTASVCWLSSQSRCDIYRCCAMPRYPPLAEHGLQGHIYQGHCRLGADHARARGLACGGSGPGPSVQGADLPAPQGMASASPVLYRHPSLHEQLRAQTIGPQAHATQAHCMRSPPGMFLSTRKRVHEAQVNMYPAPGLPLHPLPGPPADPPVPGGPSNSTARGLLEPGLARVDWASLVYTSGLQPRVGTVVLVGAGGRNRPPLSSGSSKQPPNCALTTQALP